jgi:hypothetical protein
VLLLLLLLLLQVVVLDVTVSHRVLICVAARGAGFNACAETCIEQLAALIAQQLTTAESGLTYLHVHFQERQ